MSNALNSVKNMIKTIENTSSFDILPESYYAIRIVVDGFTERETIACAKELLKRSYDSDSPSIGYGTSNTLYLLFSSLDRGKHYLSGNHHAICSYFSSSLSRLHNRDVSCSIIVFDSRVKILIYFKMKVFEHYRERMTGLIDPKDRKGLENFTEDEFNNYLIKNKIKMKLEPAELYGTFLKYDKTKGVYYTMSEQMDVSNDKYSSYIFGKE